MFGRVGKGRAGWRLLRDNRGLTLLEIVITMALGAILVTGLGGLVYQGLRSHSYLAERQDLARPGGHVLSSARATQGVADKLAAVPLLVA